MSAAVPPTPSPTGNPTSFTPPASAGLPPRPPKTIPLGPRDDGSVDISALRAAALRSAKGKAPVRENGAQAPFKSTSFATSSSHALPSASSSSVSPSMETVHQAGPSRRAGPSQDRRAADEEKEEGEISEEDELSEARERNAVAEMLGASRADWNLHAAEWEDRSIRHDKKPPSFSAFPSRSNAPSPASSRRRSPSFVGSSSAVLAPAPSRPKKPSISVHSGSVTDSPPRETPVLPQPPNEMTPAEVQQYRSILLEILHKGVSPEALIRRGVGAHHVIAICEEIVNGQQRRRELWLDTREAKDHLHGDLDRSPGDAVLARQAARIVRRRSSSPEVEVLVRTDRAGSHSSETSAEREMFEKSPPAPVPLRLKPSSSWTPEQVPPVEPVRQTALPSTIRIDSYKPEEVKWRYRSPAKSLSPQPGPSLASTSAASAAIPSSSTARPSPLTLTNPRNNLDVNNGERHSPPLSAPTGPRAMRSTGVSPDKPLVPLPPMLNRSAAPSPTLVAPTLALAEQRPLITSREVLSETRRKLLESMKLRREQAKHPNSTPSTPAQDEPPTALVAPVAAILEESVDAFMADVEREISAQQDSNAQTAMEIDSPEEGEISSPDEEVERINLISREKVIEDPSRSSARSSTSSRGIKRPTAEDLEDRPTTVAQRFVPPSKRRVFGGVAQRPQRLLINLDDDSDSDTEEQMGVTPVTAEDEAARMLAEKEESIRRLKEQIAARLKARELKRLHASVTGESSRSGSETPGDRAALAAEQEALRVAEEDIAAHADLREVAIGQQQDVEMDHDNGETPQSGQLTVNSSAGVGSPDHSDPVPSIEIDAAEETTVSDDQDRPSTGSDMDAASAAGFLPYRSLIKRYPLLTPDMSSTYLSASPARSPSPAPPTPDPPIPLSDVDHELLGNIILTNRLQSAPSAVICAAEAAGGTCADPACPDLHLSRSTEPTDRDLAEYIGLKISGVSQARIAAAVKAVRSHHLTSDLPGAQRGTDEMLGKIGALLEGFRSPPAQG